MERKGIIGKEVGKPLKDEGPLRINPKETPEKKVGIYWVPMPLKRASNS